MNITPIRSVCLGLTREFKALFLLLILLVPLQAHAASVSAFINAYTFGAGRIMIDDTLPGPSISRSVNVDYEGPRFSSAEVDVDLTTATLKVRTGGILVSSSDAAGAIGSLSDTLTFSIDQNETEFVEIGIRFHLVGTLFHNPTGGNSNATLNMALFSYSGPTLKDLLRSERYYVNNPSIGGSDPVTAADPDHFLIVSQAGDILFDNNDYGLMQGTIRLYGSSPTLEIDLSLRASGLTDFYSAATFELVDLPGDITFASESGYFLMSAQDSDGDGVEDSLDNCTAMANPGQVDTDGDGYGNSCDGDFNNDCIINFGDIAAFANEFLGTNALFDLNSDGVVNFQDFSSLTSTFLLLPGPGLGVCDANTS